MEIEEARSRCLLLRQALSNKDISSFGSFISSEEPQSIDEIVRALSVDDLSAFFEMIAEELDQNPKSGPSLLLWVKKALSAKSEALKAQPSLLDAYRAKIAPLLLSADEAASLLAQRGRLQACLGDFEETQIDGGAIIMAEEEALDKEAADIEKLFGNDEDFAQKKPKDEEEDEEEENADDEDDEEDDEDEDLEEEEEDEEEGEEFDDDEEEIDLEEESEEEAPAPKKPIKSSKIGQNGKTR
mgnify:CR=1 FL=1